MQDVPGRCTGSGGAAVRLHTVEPGSGAAVARCPLPAPATPADLSLAAEVCQEGGALQPRGLRCKPGVSAGLPVACSCRRGRANLVAMLRLCALSSPLLRIANGVEQAHDPSAAALWSAPCPACTQQLRAWGTWWPAWRSPSPWRHALGPGPSRGPPAALPGHEQVRRQRVLHASWSHAHCVASLPQLAPVPACRPERQLGRALLLRRGPALLACLLARLACLAGCAHDASHGCEDRGPCSVGARTRTTASSKATVSPSGSRGAPAAAAASGPGSALSLSLALLLAPALPAAASEPSCSASASRPLSAGPPAMMALTRRHALSGVQRHACLSLSPGGLSPPSCGPPAPGHSGPGVCDLCALTPPRRSCCPQSCACVHCPRRAQTGEALCPSKQCGAMLGQLCRRCARQERLLHRSLSSTLVWPPNQDVLAAQPGLAAALQPGAGDGSRQAACQSSAAAEALAEAEAAWVQAAGRHPGACAAVHTGARAGSARAAAGGAHAAGAHAAAGECAACPPGSRSWQRAREAALVQVKQLQRELGKWRQPTRGLKAELARRLLDLFHAPGDASMLQEPASTSDRQVCSASAPCPRLHGVLKLCTAGTRRCGRSRSSG